MDMHLMTRVQCLSRPPAQGGMVTTPVVYRMRVFAAADRAATLDRSRPAGFARLLVVDPDPAADRALAPVITIDISSRPLKPPSIGSWIQLAARSATPSTPMGLG